MFDVCVFHRLKRCFCELTENNRKVPLGEISELLGRSLWKLESNMLSTCVNNGSPVTINGGGAPV